ncbi:MAG: YdcF family protein [Myxococcaceae bacterium]
MRWARGLLAAVVVVLTAWALAAVWIDHVGTSTHDVSRPDCAVVVLGARVNEGGVASETLAARVMEGVATRREGQLLVFSGGVGDFPPAEAIVGRDLAVDAGVSAESTLVEVNSHSTRENARETVKLLKAHDVFCAHVISDPYHLARARWCFEQEAWDVTIGPVLDAPRHRSLISRMWWTAREVPAFIRLVLTE